MRGTLVGPRVLLRRLREVMAEPISAQDRLNKIVTVIAANMVAEVCSVYVLRGDGVLELYATEGLNPEAVHKAGLRLGEGLVGSIAATASPLNLPDAQHHPAFAYLPETGEEIYHSFLGVPILRAGRTLGVLVVQNRVRKSYSEEEEEALQTTAMVIAEMIAAGELSKLSPEPTILEAGRPVSLEGVGLSDGVGLGYVVLHEPRVVVTNLIAEDPEEELKRLEARSPACASPSTTCWPAARSPTTASIATCWRPTACSPTTAVGCGGWRRRWSAPASPPRPRSSASSPTPARG
ncbi:Nif-specific regulatory protein [Methylobrevis pamukkalensis]|uniref:Nif-specific regulatory protein n=1 Tax=Methylobrevis pamukkalensis TaxID=1439726 RepID=A0A1E3GXL4_9HYPH|nr:Nif-specific regulatory protein [Methylobrevis pamukkalensis]